MARSTLGANGCSDKPPVPPAPSQAVEIRPSDPPPGKTVNVVTALEFMPDSVRTRPGSGPATWQAGLCGRPGYRVQPAGSHTVRPVLADAGAAPHPSLLQAGWLLRACCRARSGWAAGSFSGGNDRDEQVRGAVRAGVDGGACRRAPVPGVVVLHPREIVVAGHQLKTQPLAWRERDAGRPDLDLEQGRLARRQRDRAVVGVPGAVGLGSFRVELAVRGPQPAQGHR